MQDATNKARPAYYAVSERMLVTIGKHVYHGTISAVAWDARQGAYAYTVDVTDGPFSTLRVYEPQLRRNPHKEQTPNE